MVWEIKSWKWYIGICRVGVYMGMGEWGRREEWDGGNV